MDSEVQDVQGLQLWKEGSTNISAYTTEDSEKNKFIVKLIAVAFLGTQDHIMHPFPLK